MAHLFSLKRCLLLSVLLGLAGWPLTVAQVMHSKASINCFEAMRRDVAGWSELYVATTGDASDLGFDSAALYWARCKAASNLKRLERLPQARERILKLRELEGRLLTHDANLAALQAGGGSAYSHGRSRAQASLEVHIGRLIALAGSPTGRIQSRSIQREHQQALLKIQGRLGRLESLRASLKTAVRNDWGRVSKSYAVTFNDLRQLLGKEINAFSLESMRFVAKGLFLP